MRREVTPGLAPSGPRAKCRGGRSGAPAIGRPRDTPRVPVWCDGDVTLRYLSAVERHGPFRDPSRDLVAYVITFGSRGDRRDVCVVCNATISKEPAFAELVDRAHESILAWGRTHYLNWQKVRAWKAVVHPGSDPKTCQLWPVPFSANAEPPAKLARAVLDSMVAVRAGEGLAVYAGSSTSDAFVPTKIRLPGSDVALLAMGDARGYEALDYIVKEGLVDKLLGVSAEQYLREAETFAEQRQWAFAFRAFYYGTLPASRDVAKLHDAALAVGQSLTTKFREAEQWDYHEWIASRTATIATALGQGAAAAVAHREAGMSCEALGRIADALAHYDQALGTLPPDPPVHLLAAIHMSIGVTTAVGLCHFEATALDRDGLDATTTRLAESALIHLDTAQRLYRSLPANDIATPLRAIEIDRLRLTDLLGRHEEALEGFDAALAAMGPTDFPLLRASVLAYRLACTKKLVDTAGTHVDEFRSLIEAVLESREELICFPPDRSCLWTALAGRVALADRQPELAADCFELGLMRQEQLLAPQIRVPSAEDVRLGPLAIDFPGMLQLARLAHVWPKRPSPSQPHRQAFLVGEEAKGRFFRRDLEFGIRVPAAAGLEQDYRQRLNVAIRNRTYDERIVHADGEWLDQEAPDARLSPAAPDDRALVDLYSRLPERTVVVSLYAMADRTLVYAAHDPLVLRLAAVLQIPMKALAAAGQLLRAHFSRHPLYPLVSADDPARYQERFLQPFEDLIAYMKPIAEIISDYDLAVIIPHGPWHSLPIHAMLLPTVWESGRSTGVVYAPSLGVLTSLVRRFGERELFRRFPSGVATVPHSGNDPGQFRELHERLKRSLGSNGRTVVGLYGEEATAEALAESLTVVGVQHVLAHGVSNRQRVLASGLMLGGDGLPPAELSLEAAATWHGFVSAGSLAAFDVAADHVTVHACSLGTVVPGMGEEFWGVTRSLLLAGASTVMAPLWDVHPQSSTALLVDFYERWLGRGLERWEAWSEAQRTLYEDRSRNSWSHYYHWAPFRMIGVP